MVGQSQANSQANSFPLFPTLSIKTANLSVAFIFNGQTWEWWWASHLTLLQKANKCQTVVITASSFHTNQNEAVSPVTCAYRKTFTVHETHSTTLKLLHIRTSLSVCMRGFVPVFCDNPKWTQKDTIYTARLLNDIVYYIYFSYRNNVSVLVLNGQHIPAEDESYLPASVEILLIKLY